MKIILLGIVAGIGVGIGSLILLDSMDRSVKTVDALNGFGLPILAVIPHIQIPAEIKKTRIKDLALYTFTGIYYTGIAAVLVLEMLGKEIQ
jgi:succinoglycan biosynthesis transport protein ExoP